MALNREQEVGNRLSLDVSGVNGSGAGNLVQSGDPLAVGQIPGVALTDEDSAGLATVQTDGVFRLNVHGFNSSTSAAVSAGDIVYWDDTAGELNLDSVAGIRFGYALEAVVAGATTEINVKVGY